MRHQLGWTDLSSVRVGVFGAGVEGRSTLRRLRELTDEIVVVDDNPSVLLDDHDVLATRDGGLHALQTCDVVIKSPGISRYRDDVMALEAQGVAVVGGVGLTIHDRDRSQIMCITGTKGKSTTASLIGHLAQGFGLRVGVTGNIGLPPFDPDVADTLDLLVIETSSFQACDVADAPGIVVVTSLSVDHVDWHGSAERYHADKLSLTALPGAGITIAQQDSPELVAHQDLLGGDLRWSSPVDPWWTQHLGLVGAHNVANAQLAADALVAFGIDAAADPTLLSTAAAGYKELPGRLNLVAEFDGVRFIDDSLATNVLPTLAALASFEGERVALLLGGYDRGIDYSELIDVLATRDAPTLVIGLPDSGARLVAEISAVRGTTETALAGDISQATALGATWASGGGVVLLSPAAPSFSQFANWKERSAAFRDAVLNLSH